MLSCWGDSQQGVHGRDIEHRVREFNIRFCWKCFLHYYRAAILPITHQSVRQYESALEAKETSRRHREAYVQTRLASDVHFGELKKMQRIQHYENLKKAAVRKSCLPWMRSKNDNSCIIVFQQAFQKYKRVKIHKNVTRFSGVCTRIFFLPTFQFQIFQNCPYDFYKI